jgi:hypothetical protein
MAEKHEEWKKKLDDGMLPMQMARDEDVGPAEIRKALIDRYGEAAVIEKIQANRKKVALERRAARQEAAAEAQEKTPEKKGPWDRRAPKEFAALLGEAKKADKLDKLVNMHFKAIANIRAAMKSPK